MKFMHLFILIRHGINPFKKMSKSIDILKKRLTEKEKDFFVNNAKSENSKKLWRTWLY